MEIITGVERRPWWRDEEKPRIVAEADAPGTVRFQSSSVLISSSFDEREQVRIPGLY
jgi:hypothetical protein